MNAVAILALVEKGMTIISALLAAGQTAAPAISALTGLVQKGQTGTVTDSDLDAVEGVLDQQIDEFNLDL
jgi:hypothetical protein